MVLTKSELLGLLQNEVHILQHLCTKIDAVSVNYRPTGNQRSTLELLKYLAVMGPVLVKSALGGTFDQDSWVSRQAALADADLPAVVAALAAHAEEYNTMLAAVPDETFRADVEFFGSKYTVGSAIVALVLAGCAAYRTQLFCYLKASGRSELGTMNLWAGIDAPPAA